MGSRIGRRSGSPVAARAVTVLAATALAGAAVLATAKPDAPTELVSVRSDGQGGGNRRSTAARPSDSGRYVAFWGDASDLVEDDDNGNADVFVRDLATDRTELISVRADGGGSAGGFSHGPAMSGNGRWVAFTSDATDLDAGAKRSSPRGSEVRSQIWLRDRSKGTTTLVSVNLSGDDFANGRSGGPCVSADGRWVAFISDADDLIGEPTAPGYDVYLRDMKLGVTSLVSVRPDGAAANSQSTLPAMSANGRYVAFTSDATDLGPEPTPPRQAWIRDVKKGTTRLVSVRADGGGAGNDSAEVRSISPDGRYVGFESRSSDLTADADANGSDDVFVRDVRRGVTILASPAADGTGTADEYSEEISVSGNGRRVVFYSYATDLVEGGVADGNEHLYFRDLAKGKTTLLSMNHLGTAPAAGNSSRPRITPNGRVVVWDGDATDLVPGDTNGSSDVFLRRLR